MNYNNRNQRRNMDDHMDDRMDMEDRMDMDRMGMRRRTTDMMLADDISKAIVGEVQAYYFYDALAEMADNDKDRETIKSIQEDEAKHYQWFSTLLKDMGRELPRVPAGQQPRDFEQGVKSAIQDELAANEFYLDISYRATDPDIKMTFLYASQDEQRHATLLTNILMSLQ